MSIQIVEYIQETGSSPYEEWFRTLDSNAATKVATAVLRMSQGNLSNVKWLRGIGEYKIDFGPGYRIYLGKDGERLIVLLGGGIKKRQQKDIEMAVQLWAEYKQRKQKNR
jgi:putative addiction module killer protein